MSAFISHYTYGLYKTQLPSESLYIMRKTLFIQVHMATLGQQCRNQSATCVIENRFGSKHEKQQQEPDTSLDGQMAKMASELFALAYA